MVGSSESGKCDKCSNVVISKRSKLSLRKLGKEKLTLCICTQPSGKTASQTVCKEVGVQSKGKCKILQNVVVKTGNLLQPEHKNVAIPSTSGANVQNVGGLNILKNILENPVFADEYAAANGINPAPIPIKKSDETMCNLPAVSAPQSITSSQFEVNAEILNELPNLESFDMLKTSPISKNKYRSQHFDILVNSQAVYGSISPVSPASTFKEADKEDEFINLLQSGPAVNQTTGLGLEAWSTCESMFAEPELVDELCESMDAWDKPEDQERLNEDVGVARNAPAPTPPVALALRPAGDEFDEFISSVREERWAGMDGQLNRIRELKAEQAAIERDVAAFDAQLLHFQDEISKKQGCGFRKYRQDILNYDKERVRLLQKRIRKMKVWGAKEDLIDDLYRQVKL